MFEHTVSNRSTHSFAVWQRRGTSYNKNSECNLVLGNLTRDTLFVKFYVLNLNLLLNLSFAQTHSIFRFSKKKKNNKAAKNRTKRKHFFGGCAGHQITNFYFNFYLRRKWNKWIFEMLNTYTHSHELANYPLDLSVCSILM